MGSGGLSCFTNTFNLVIELFENLLTLDENLESDFLGRISEYSIKAFHLFKLSLLVSILTFFQLSYHPIQERDIMLHGGKFIGVGIHSPKLV